MEKPKLLVIMGSVRNGRFNDQPANWILEHAKKQFHAELVDLKDYPMPFYVDQTTPSYIKDGNYSDPTVKKFAQKIKEAQAFIIVSPEYNHSISGVLKNAIDHVYAEWNNKQIAYLSYGSWAGGSRAVEHLRLIAVELQMAPIRQGVHIANYWENMENGKFKFEKYEAPAQQMLDQLLWWANALNAARK